MLLLLITLSLVQEGIFQNTRINTDNQYPYEFRIEKEVRNNLLLHCTGTLVDEDWIVNSDNQINTVHITLSVSHANRTNQYCSDNVKVFVRVVHPTRPVFYDDV